MIQEIAVTWRELAFLVAKHGFHHGEVNLLIGRLESEIARSEWPDEVTAELFRRNILLASLLPTVKEAMNGGFQGDVDAKAVCFLAAQPDLAEEMKQEVVKAAIETVSQRGLKYVNVLKYQTVADWFFAALCQEWISPSRSVFNFHILIYGLIAANPGKRVEFFNIQRDILLRTYSNAAGADSAEDADYCHEEVVKTLAEYIEFRGEDATDDEAKLIVDVLDELFNWDAEMYAEEFSGRLINWLGPKGVKFYDKLIPFYMHEFYYVDVPTVTKVLELGGKIAAEAIFELLNEDCSHFVSEYSAEKCIGICILLRQSGFIDPDALNEYIAASFADAITEGSAQNCLQQLPKLRQLQGPCHEDFVEEVFARVYEATGMVEDPETVSLAIEGLWALIRWNSYKYERIKSILKDIVKAAKSDPLTSAEVQLLSAFQDIFELPKSLATHLKKFIKRHKKLESVDVIACFNLAQVLGVKWPEDHRSGSLQELKTIAELSGDSEDPRWTEVMADIPIQWEALPWFLIRESARIVMHTFFASRKFLAVRLWLLARKQVHEINTVTDEFLIIDFAKSILGC